MKELKNSENTANVDGVARNGDGCDDGNDWHKYNEKK